MTHCFLRKQLGLRPAPEFEEWLISQGIINAAGELMQPDGAHRLLKFG